MPLWLRLKRYMHYNVCGILSCRPDFYPPAYEESLDSEKHTCPAPGEALDIPPPLYTEKGFELQGENDAYPEAPPSYQASTADLVSAATAEDAERPSPGPKAGHTLVGICC